MHALIRRLPALGALALWLAAAPAWAQSGAPATSARIALVPLDDRPSSLQLPTMLAAVADTEVLTPPRVVLGRYMKTGDGDAIARWLDALDLTTLDAVVVSADMLAYGGLMGSRVPRVFEADARRRLEAIPRLKQRRPDLRVYAFASMLGQPATAEGDNDAWRSTRARNHAMQLVLVDVAAQGALDYLLFGRDPATAGDALAADHEAIADAIAKVETSSRIAIHSGVDEMPVLLLTRALTARVNLHPTVQAVYSSSAAADAVVPSGGRVVKDIVASSVAIAGGRLDPRGALQLFVYASRHETPDQTDAFASRVAQAVAGGRRVVVADIDPKGEQPGAWLPLMEGLRTRKLIPRLAGYAASNTAGGTIGTALAHGLLFSLAVEKIAPASNAAGLRVAAAHVRVLLHQAINDFLYQGIVREQTIEDFVRPRAMNPLRLDDSGRARVEKHLTGELKPLAESLTADFTSQPWRLPGPSGRRSTVGLTVKDIEGFGVTLPWGRMVEAEIGFALITSSADSVPRPPRPRILPM